MTFCIQYVRSLLVAIGIEAFNKFSEEQKAESEEIEGESEVHGGGSIDEDQSLCSKVGGKKLLKNIVQWTGTAISSTRVNTKYSYTV